MALLMKMETTMDQLTKDILFVGQSQPGLQVGAWERGRGFKNGKVTDITVYNRELTAFETRVLAGKSEWKEIAVKQRNELSDTDVKVLKEYYVGAVDPAVRSAMEQLKSMRTELSDSTENIEELMIMQEMPIPKKSYVLKRGNYDTPGEQVFPATRRPFFRFLRTCPKTGLAWLNGQQAKAIP
jgi:hypothetical protein